MKLAVNPGIRMALSGKYSTVEKVQALVNTNLLLILGSMELIIIGHIKLAFYIYH